MGENVAMRISFVTFAAALSLAPAAFAETRQIWESPGATVSQTIGITDIQVSYHRPGVKGREIWGKLVPYGQVWRAGANEATTISFSTAVKVAGKNVPAGTYALFVLPTKDKWTFILSKKSEQWGAYFYKPEDDQLRFDVTPASAAAREWLAYELEPQGKNSVTAALHWDKLKASFPIEADVDGLYAAYLGSEVAKADASSDGKQRFATYFSAAKYWIGRGEKLSDAAKLLDKAEAVQPSFWVYEYRARLLAKQGKIKDALPLLDKAKQAAAGKTPKEYANALDELRGQWLSGKSEKSEKSEKKN
jgi:hypothetical protein